MKATLGDFLNYWLLFEIRTEVILIYKGTPPLPLQNNGGV
jgi:hypothetical protein